MTSPRAILENSTTSMLKLMMAPFNLVRQVQPKPVVTQLRVPRFSDEKDGDLLTQDGKGLGNKNNWAPNF